MEDKSKMTDGGMRPGIHLSLDTYMDYQIDVGLSKMFVCDEREPV